MKHMEYVNFQFEVVLRSVNHEKIPIQGVVLIEEFVMFL